MAFEKSYSRHNIDELIKLEPQVRQVTRVLEDIVRITGTDAGATSESLGSAKFFKALTTSIEAFKEDRPLPPEVRRCVVRHKIKVGTDVDVDFIKVALDFLERATRTGKPSPYSHEVLSSASQEAATTAHRVLNESGLADAFKNKNLAYDIATHDEILKERVGEKGARFADRARTSKPGNIIGA